MFLSERTQRGGSGHQLAFDMPKTTSVTAAVATGEHRIQSAGGGDHRSVPSFNRTENNYSD